MEEFEMYEEENSEWIKGLQVAKDFHPIIAEDRNQMTSRMNCSETNPPAVSIETRSQGSEEREPAALSAECFTLWEQHGRQSPFQPVELKSPPKYFHPIRRSFSFDQTLSTAPSTVAAAPPPPAPVMVESYLPTTHGVIRITFPSLSHPSTTTTTNTTTTNASHSNSNSNSNSATNNIAHYGEAISANHHISEIVRNHLAQFYQLPEEGGRGGAEGRRSSMDRQRAQSLPVFPSSSYQEMKDHGGLYPFESNLTSATSTATSLSPSPVIHPSTRTTTAASAGAMPAPDYFSLFYSDSSDGEEREQSRPAALELTKEKKKKMMMIMKKRRREVRKKPKKTANRARASSLGVVSPSPIATDEEEEEGSEDLEDKDYYLEALARDVRDIEEEEEIELEEEESHNHNKEESEDPDYLLSDEEEDEEEEDDQDGIAIRTSRQQQGKRKKRKRGFSLLTTTSTSNESAPRRPNNTTTPGPSKEESSSHLPPRRKASQFARDILMDWLVEHEVNPYPTKRQKQDLANKTGLTLKQIVHWMSNIRKRRLLPLLGGKRAPTSNVDMKFLER